MKQHCNKLNHKKHTKLEMLHNVGANSHCMIALWSSENNNILCLQYTDLFF